MKTRIIISFVAFMLSYAIVANAQNNDVDTIEIADGFIETGSTTVITIKTILDFKGDFVTVSNRDSYSLSYLAKSESTGQLNYKLAGTPTAFSRFLSAHTEHTGTRLFAVIYIKVKGKEGEVLGYSPINNALIVSDDVTLITKSECDKYLNYIKQYITPAEKSYYESNPKDILEQTVFLASIFNKSVDQHKEIERNRILKRMAKDTRNSIRKILPIECIGVNPESKAALFKHSLVNFPYSLFDFFVDEYIRKESKGKYGLDTIEDNKVFADSLREKFLKKLDKLTD